MGEAARALLGRPGMNLRSDPTVINSSPPVDVLTSFDLREVQAELEMVKSSSRIALPAPAASRVEAEVDEVLALCGDLDRSSLSAVLSQDQAGPSSSVESFLWFAGGFSLAALLLASLLFVVLRLL